MNNFVASQIRFFPIWVAKMTKKKQCNLLLFAFLPSSSSFCFFLYVKVLTEVQKQRQRQRQSFVSKQKEDRDRKMFITYDFDCCFIGWDRDKA